MSKRAIALVVVGLILSIIACCTPPKPAVQPPEYLPLDTPEAPILNAFWAFQQGDTGQAIGQYTGETRAKMGRFAYIHVTNTDKLYILGTEPTPDNDPDALLVKINQVGHIGNTWLPNGGCERAVRVEHTRDGWKIADPEEEFWCDGSSESL